MIVVGSGRHGDWGRVVARLDGDRLLHSSPIPVAVAPRGFRAPAGGRVTRATCAFRADEASRSALARTAEHLPARPARSCGWPRSACSGATMYPPEVLGEKQILDRVRRADARRPRGAVAALPAAATGVETVVATGRDWPEALGRWTGTTVDVLVVGSSHEGLLSQVFIGTNATRIVRHSPVPAVVVPR